MDHSSLLRVSRIKAALGRTVLVLAVVVACSIPGVLRAAAANQPTEKPKEASTPLRQKGYYPISPYPEAARKAHIWGTGKVRTSFDAKGKVISAVMVESTGNALLDSNVTDFIIKHWRSPGGKPYVHDTNVVYGFFRNGQRYYTPDPPYGSPTKLPAGAGPTIQVRVTFEKNGVASKVVVVKSSGSNRLDKMTATFIKDHWVSYLRIHEVDAVEIQFSPDAPMR